MKKKYLLSLVMSIMLIFSISVIDVNASEIVDNNQIYIDNITVLNLDSFEEDNFYQVKLVITNVNHYPIESLYVNDQFVPNITKEEIMNYSFVYFDFPYTSTEIRINKINYTMNSYTYTDNTYFALNVNSLLEEPVSNLNDNIFDNDESFNFTSYLDIEFYYHFLNNFFYETVNLKVLDNIIPDFINNAWNYMFDEDLSFAQPICSIISFLIILSIILGLVYLFITSLPAILKSCKAFFVVFLNGFTKIVTGFISEIWQILDGLINKIARVDRSEDDFDKL